MDSLKRRVLETIQKYQMILPGEKIIVGVSGGPDSTALLYLLYELREKLGFTLHVAHLDHELRGGESKADAEYVMEQAQKLGLLITIEAINVRKRITSKESLESGARRIRYEFYERVLASVKGDKIAQGHTADDQAETVLMRLLRGSGSQGLGGIPPIRDKKYIRPLIEISRQEIEAYLEDLKITPRVDASNLSTEYERNRIRLELIPLLEKSKPNIKQILQQTGELLRADDELLTVMAEDSVARCAKYDDKRIEIDIPYFSGLHIAIQRRILRFAVKKLAGNLLSINYQHIADLLKLALSQPTGNMISLPHGLVAEKTYDKLTIRRGYITPVEAYDYCIKIPGEMFIPELSLSIKITQPEKIRDYGYVNKDRFQASFDYDKIQGDIHLRNKRPGDKFQPLGMSGTKKLQDFFVDEKIPKNLRDRIPILADENGILWVVGYRMDDRVKITEKTKNRIDVVVLR